MEYVIFMVVLIYIGNCLLVCITHYVVPSLLFAIKFTIANIWDITTIVYVFYIA